MSSFKDYFSGHSSDYQKYRPVYPVKLFEYISGLCEECKSVLDVGTGNGQAAHQLANYFDKVIATDPSANQIKSAKQHEKITFQVSRAEECPVEDNSLDLLTVAQALHWFDFDKFFEEAKRVLKPNGVLAVWTYPLCSVSPEIDEIVDRLYSEIVGEYWSFERKYVEGKYQGIDIPFKEINAPEFDMKIQYNLTDYLAYLSTWSAVKKYDSVNGSNPIEIIGSEMHKAWGSKDKERTVTWPIYFRVGKF